MPKPAVETEEPFVSAAHNIDEAILEVMNKVGYVKKTKSGGLNYTFAGERALIKALRPAMIESGIIMLPLTISDLAKSNYTTGKGTAMINTSLTTTFRLVHAPSGSFRDVPGRGEGSDAGDKSDAKASTGSLKYALRQTFLIETGDESEATPDKEVERATPARPAASQPVLATPGVASTPVKNKTTFIQAASRLGYDLADVTRILPKTMQPYTLANHDAALAVLQAEHDKPKEAARE